MKIIYTESGKLALESYKERRAKELEATIKQRKYVLGDDLIEITGSDVKEAQDDMGYSRVVLRRRSSIKFLLQVYFVIGLLMAFGGVFYEDIIYIFTHRPQQIALIVGGLAFSVVCGVMLWRFRDREQNEEDLLRVERLINREVAKDAQQSVQPDGPASGGSAS